MHKCRKCGRDTNQILRSNGNKSGVWKILCNDCYLMNYIYCRKCKKLKSKTHFKKIKKVVNGRVCKECTVITYKVNLSKRHATSEI